MPVSRGLKRSQSRSESVWIDREAPARCVTQAPKQAPRRERMGWNVALFRASQCQTFFFIHSVEQGKQKTLQAPFRSSSSAKAASAGEEEPKTGWRSLPTTPRMRSGAPQRPRGRRKRGGGLKPKRNKEEGQQLLLIFTDDARVRASNEEQRVRCRKTLPF